MSSLELDAFHQAVANIALETNALTPELIALLKQSIENNMSTPEIIERVLQTT